MLLHGDWGSGFALLLIETRTRASIEAPLWAQERGETIWCLGQYLVCSSRRRVFLCWRTGQSDILCAGKQRRMATVVKIKFCEGQVSAAFLYLLREDVGKEQDAERSIQGWGLFGQAVDKLFYASIFQAGRLTLLVFLLSNCVPLSSFEAFYESPDYHTPREQLQSCALFFLAWRNGDIYCAECTAPACFIVCVGKMLLVIEKYWLRRGILDLEWICFY